MNQKRTDGFLHTSYIYELISGVQSAHGRIIHLDNLSNTCTYNYTGGMIVNIKTNNNYT